MVCGGVVDQAAPRRDGVNILPRPTQNAPLPASPGVLFASCREYDHLQEDMGLGCVRPLVNGRWDNL